MHKHFSIINLHTQALPYGTNRGQQKKCKPFYTLMTSTKTNTEQKNTN